MERKIEIAALTYEKAKKLLGKPEFLTEEEYFANHIEEKDESDSDTDDNKKDKN